MFKANRKSWQYKCIRFGIADGGINFQQAINRFLEEENLTDVYTYQDDIIVCSRSQEEHDFNVSKLLNAFRHCKLMIYENKFIQFATQINVLSYQIQHKIIKPDPDRLKPLPNFTLLQNKNALQQRLGMLAYYAKWIPKLTNKVKSLATIKSLCRGMPHFCRF